MPYREIELIQFTIDNGRIYFPSTDIKFFPTDSMADRAKYGHKGKPVAFGAAGEEFETDIRISSVQRISPQRTMVPSDRMATISVGKAWMQFENPHILEKGAA